MRPSPLHERIVRPFIEGLARVLGIAMSLCFAAMMATLFWQVVSRFVIQVPATWTEEAARYCFIYMAFFGAALGVHHSTHFGVTLLTSTLRGRGRDRYHRFVVQVPILIASIALLVYGSRYLMEFGFSRRSPTFHFSMAWVYLVIPLSAVPMILFSLNNILFGNFSQPAGSDLAGPLRSAASSSRASESGASEQAGR